MYSKLALTACVIVLTGSISTSYSQPTSSGYEAAFNVSGLVYQGDLTPERFGSYRTMKPGVGVSVSRFFNPYLAVRGGLNVNWLRGDDAAYSDPEYRKERSFSFNSTILELSVVGVYNIAGSNGNNNYRGLSPYVFAGIAYNHLWTRPDTTGFNISYFGNESEVVAGLNADLQRGPVRNLPVIPVGAGVRYPITPSLSVAVEANYRLFWSDYLDGFSQAASPKFKDHYYSYTASIVYTFGRGGDIRCPEVPR